MTAAIGITLLATAAVASAYSNSLAKPGTWKGQTQVGEPVRLEIVKSDGQKMVDKVIVDETSTGCEKTVITKDAVIKKGSFEVKQNGFGVSGVWTTKGSPDAGIAGGTQGDCRGSDPSGKNNIFSAFLVD